MPVSPSTSNTFLPIPFPPGNNVTNVELVDDKPSGDGIGPRWQVLRREGVMVVVDVMGPRLPRVIYWGSDLGQLCDEDIARLPLGAGRMGGSGPADRGHLFTLSPTRADGWPGWPGLSGHREGYFSQPLFRSGSVSMADRESGVALLYRGTDAAAALALEGELELTVDGVLKHRQSLTNIGATDVPPYVVDDLVSLLPLPPQVVDVQDLTGHWAHEADPQRHRLGQGTWLREQRRGRTGPDTPLVLFAGEEGFGYRKGEVWGAHLGWSGDQRYLLQRLNTGTTLVGTGELMAPGEVILGAGQSVTTPWSYGVYSFKGMDGAAARFHAMLRRRPQHPKNPRPVVLNTWEAVYFNMSFERLARLADAAADIGIERFVIDDGWFGSRRNDTSGLGDWYESPDVWPQGLGPIVDHVRKLGMSFGLWFEPEMVNPSSDLARAHPDWVMGTEGRMPPTVRGQQVLDIANPQAFTYLLRRLDSLVSEHEVDFIKWDHNRDLADPVHRSGPRQGRPAVRDQTLAAYRLMDELHRRHPALEIESCSSGGSRIDLGVMERADRVWASDCIDPIERSRIVPALAALLPLELIGSHVASERSSSTGRRHDLALRLAVATFGHQGIEWDITSITPEERRALKEWVAWVKSVRLLVHTGELVRIERPSDPGTNLYGVVAPDRAEAIFVLVRYFAATQSESVPVSLDGLDPQARYVVRRIDLGLDHSGYSTTAEGPGSRGIALLGSVLMGPGIQPPALSPEDAALFHLLRQAG